VAIFVLQNVMVISMAARQLTIQPLWLSAQVSCQNEHICFFLNVKDYNGRVLHIGFHEVPYMFRESWLWGAP